jgi:L-fucose mutarotase
MAKRRVAIAGFWYNCRMQINRKEFIAGIGATGVALACGISSARSPKGGSMLKGISPVVSPDLLKVLAEMGHGDEIVFADAHFPAHTFGRDGAIVLRADAVACDTLLAGVIPLFELDAYAVPVVMMAAVPGDTLDPAVEKAYRSALGYNGKIELMERFAFYERAKKAYAIVLTGELRKYGNIIIKKGVIPVG